MNRIKEIILRRIKEKGKISFKEFMDISLYYPDIGYYYLCRPGKNGDFITSPTSSKLFGFTISNFLIKISPFFKGDFTILELGGGEGFLAKDILNFLREKKPLIFEKIEYKIFELSKKDIDKEKIYYLDSLNSIKEMEGIVISNEFFDSLPFRIIENFKGEIKELYIKLRGEELIYELEEPSNESLDYIKRFNLKIEEGVRTELRVEDFKFMEKIKNLIKRGGILTIDYGSEVPKLSTYRAFKNHKLLNDLLSEPGEMDITSDVNFELLRLVGREYGFEEVFFLSQERFLLQFGILEIIENMGKEESLKNQAKILLSPEFMGGRFKFLFQVKSIPELVSFFNFSL